MGMRAASYDASGAYGAGHKSEQKSFREIEDKGFVLTCLTAEGPLVNVISPAAAEALKLKGGLKTGEVQQKYFRKVLSIAERKGMEVVSTEDKLYVLLRTEVSDEGYNPSIASSDTAALNRKTRKIMELEKVGGINELLG